MAKGVVRVDDDVGLAGDERGAGDLRIDFAVLDMDSAFENAANDAFLAPEVARLEFAIGVKAGQLRTGAGAAGRAVIFLAGAQNEILAVNSGNDGGPVQLDVIDFMAVSAADSVFVERAANRPGEIGKRGDVLHAQFQRIVFHQEKPVAGPRHIAVDRAVAGDIHRYIRCRPAARDVQDAHFARWMQRCGDPTDGGLYNVFPDADSSQVGKRHDQTNGAMHAHANESDVVEEDDPGGRGRVNRLAKNSADHHFGAARLGDQRFAQIIVVRSEAREALGHPTGAEVGPACHQDARWLPAGMGIDDVETTHVLKHALARPL